VMGRAEVQPSVNVLMRADPIVHYTIAFTVTGHADSKRSGITSSLWRAHV
jgi:hypothetical protein